MRNHDAADDPRACCQDDPVDHMEPGQEIPDETPEQFRKRIERETYREASIKFFATTMAILNFLHESRTASEMSARLWVVSSALDHECVQDFDSNTQIAEKLGISKADYSKHLVTFQRANSLPPSSFQKRVAARESYRQSRKFQLATE